MSVTLCAVMVMTFGMLVMAGTEEGPFMMVVGPTTWRTGVVVRSVSPALGYAVDE